MKTYIIYKYTSPNGKKYIGQTSNLFQRQTSHKRAQNGCRAFNRAIRKYGYENFLFEILEENLTLEDANIKEEYYIEFYDTFGENGYNLQSGGLNRIQSDETKELISKNHANINGENNPFYGKTHSLETLEMQKSSHSKENLSEETLMKMRNSAIGRLASIETKQKLSDMRSGENHLCYGKFGKDHYASKSFIITFPDEHEELIIGMAEFCKKIPQILVL